ncbi:MAG: hypothetical protein AB7N80_10055 [Bdellovibrionales bacterium]
MKARALTILTLLAPLLLAACDNKGDNSRGKIDRLQRTGAVQAQDLNKTCKIFPNDCLDLVALNECLKNEDNQVARLATLNISLFNAGQDVNNSEPLNNPKLLAQLLNQGGDLSIRYELKRLKDFRGHYDILNATVQNKCSSVVLKEANGNLQEYDIKTSQKNSSSLALVGKKTKRQIRLSFRGGQLLIKTIEPLDKLTVCNQEQNLQVQVDTEISYGTSAYSPMQISQGLGELISKHSDASDTLNQALKESTKQDKRTAEQRQRKMISRMPINDNVFVEAQSRLQKGQYKDIECAESAKLAIKAK